MIDITVNKRVRLKEFSFINKHGGTSLSNWEHNEKFSGDALVMITERWEDYETGYRFIGESIDAELDLYLGRNADPNDKRIFFSEFDVVD